MKEMLRLLLVEDSEDDTFFMSRELDRGGLRAVVEQVYTLSSVTAALDREPWDLVICDHTLPGFSSLHVLSLINERKLDIPFIIVSGTIGEEVAVQAMKSGANDYVLKSQLARLVPSIERELREAETRRARREAEAALRRSEQELQDFFDQATVGLHWMGADGTILRVNRAELDLLGYEHGEFAGHRITEFYADKSRAEEAIKRLVAGESLKDFEASLICKDGTVKHVLINSNVFRENGKFIHSRCFVRDITERKHEEEERLRLINELTEALAKIKTLSGLLPICAACKNIRDDRGYWSKIESYISAHTQAEFTHGICPDCVLKLYPQYTLKGEGRHAVTQGNGHQEVPTKCESGAV